MVRSLAWTVLIIIWHRSVDWRKLMRNGSNHCEYVGYRRILRISWTEHGTDQSILTELNITSHLHGLVVRRKLIFLGHTIRIAASRLIDQKRCEVLQGPRATDRHSCMMGPQKKRNTALKSKQHVNNTYIMQCANAKCRRLYNMEEYLRNSSSDGSKRCELTRV